MAIAGFCIVTFMAMYPTLATCNFLAARDLESMSADNIDLLHELETKAGRDHRIATEQRIARLEAAMQPTFTALPKDTSGRLGSSGVRYLLHRFFVQRHGWYVKGLDNAGDAWNTSSPAEFIGTHVHEEIQDAFDKKLNSNGFDLHHVAVLAATLENFVHAEAIERLQVAYKITGLDPSDSKAAEAKVTRAMHTYLLMYVLQRQKHYSNVTRQWVDDSMKKIHKIFPTWHRSLQFLEKVRKAVLDEASTSDGNESLNGTSHSWNVALKILERFGEGYGRIQNEDCIDLKQILVNMEIPNTGRVPLHRFYGNLSTDSSWAFSESVPYLRILGALDESDPKRPSVIIPNYLTGQNNCVAGSKFYGVCCMDECEELIGHLEQTLAVSEATPQQITALVVDLHSDTVSTPRNLTPALIQRLDDIANHHGGRVPLHGRLFAQWMHHAYPRECPYPHVSGTTRSMTVAQFKKETGERGVVQAEHASQIIKEIIEYGPDDEDTELPWSSEEELFVCKPDGNDKKSDRMKSARGLALAFSAFFCTLVILVRLVPTAEGVKAVTHDTWRHKFV